MTITPSLLASLLDTHAIGADAPGGTGSIHDRSFDGDHSEVHIVGVYNLAKVAKDLSEFNPVRSHRKIIPEVQTGVPPFILWGIVVLQTIVTAILLVLLLGM
jgi:hypothetical protein